MGLLCPIGAQRSCSAVAVGLPACIISTLRLPGMVGGLLSAVSLLTQDFEVNRWLLLSAQDSLKVSQDCADGVNVMPLPAASCRILRSSHCRKLDGIIIKNRCSWNSFTGLYGPYCETYKGITAACLFSCCLQTLVVN